MKTLLLSILLILVSNTASARTIPDIIHSTDRVTSLENIEVTHQYEILAKACLAGEGRCDVVITMFDTQSKQFKKQYAAWKKSMLIFPTFKHDQKEQQERLQMINEEG